MHGQDLPDGPFVVQCKFLARRDQTLSLSGIKDELAKIRKLVSRGICKSYALMTNAKITGLAEQEIRAAIAEEGVAHPLVFGGQWLNQTIALSQRLRMFVPRIYGLGDLSQILDERAYVQARALLDYLQEDLSTFVVTDAYRRAAEAISLHGFCLLLGEPAVGKSVIAATLAMSALDHWSSLTIRADGPEDVVNHWNPNEPNQFFWIDDTFGAVRHDSALTEGWSRRLPKVMAAVKGGAKIVLTSRDYIYREARPLLKEYAYPLLHENKVVINVEDLSVSERKQIVYNHIRLGDQPISVRQSLKPYLHRVADFQPFRPEVVRRLGRKSFTGGMTMSGLTIEQFVSKPHGFLQDVFQALSPDLQGALAIVYQARELAAPFDIATDERIGLLAEIGSSPREVNKALKVLEGTFLRCSPKPGGPDVQEYWSFRHPTLREGFAAFIAGDRNLLRTFIDGLSDDDLLTQLDCGTATKKGVLVSVPPPLYGVVAERVFNIYQKMRVAPLDWDLQHRWRDFFALQCSKGFLEEYLAIDKGFVERTLRVGSYMSVTRQVDVLANIRDAGFLTDGQRIDALAAVGDLAVEIPDADWLDIPGIYRLFNKGEIESLLNRVRDELISNLDNTIRNWELNEQGESAEDYYEPLRLALERYRTEFENDKDIVARLDLAIDDIESAKSNSSNWDNGEEVEYHEEDEDDYLERRSSRIHLNAEIVTVAEIDDRSFVFRDIFDDVDSQ